MIKNAPITIDTVHRDLQIPLVKIRMQIMDTGSISKIHSKMKMRSGSGLVAVHRILKRMNTITMHLQDSMKNAKSLEWICLLRLY